MSAPQQKAKVPFFKLFVLPALWLFVIPLIAWVFSAYVLHALDEKFDTAMDARVDAANLSAADKTASHDFVHAHAPSLVCATTDAEGARLRERLCETWGEVWQFDLARKAAIFATAQGVAALLAALALGALAFRNRHAQYVSFVLGWRGLVLVSAVETLVQGVLATWLCFWVPAWFLQHYSIKLLAVFGVLAGAGVFAVIWGIFKRLPEGAPLQGELVREQDAPELWARVRELAARIGTAPPRQIVAGIDANFFVSEAPLALPGQKLEGRTLYVSLPLLRLLDEEEADAVLAHELAHFEGGDARSGARLGPKISQYDQYCATLSGAFFTRPVFYLMQLYRAIFEFALKREMREREFIADRKAGMLRSAAALVHALIKVSAYAIYRGHTERELFARSERHQGAIGIAQTVGAGLAQYAVSPRFVADMQASHMPHPFDSHPRLAERMANVGHQVQPAEFGAAVTRPPARTWAQAILTGEAIEARLWGAYEEMFRAAHERNLAYRYEPSNDDERAVVLRHFPPQRFELKNGDAIIVTYEGFAVPGEIAPIGWDEVESAVVEKDAVLVVNFRKLTGTRTKPVKIKLGPLGKQKEAFKSAFGNYWGRHQVMRKNQQG